MALLLFFLFIAVVRSDARTWYILPDGAGDAPSVQAGIDSAFDGDLVLLADGVHFGDGRHVDYFGKKITVRSESDDPTRCAIDMNGDYSLRFQSGEDTTSVFRGIAIVNSAGTSAILGRYNSSPTLINCDFSGTDGARLYFSNATFIDCIFNGTYGGLICQESSPRAYGCVFTGQQIECVTLFYAGYPVRPLFEKCIFSGNIGDGNASGGAVWTRSANPVFMECTFTGNTGPGIIIARDMGTITNCTFFGNQAHKGAGVYLYNSTAGIFDCIFEDNIASEQGGAIYISDATCLIDSCSFVGNSASAGGAIANASYATIGVLHSTFARNSATEDGGCFFIRSRYPGEVGVELDIVDCTLVENEAPAGGAVLSLQNSETYIENTIIAFTACGTVLDCDEASSITVSCSNIYGNAQGDWTGCLDGQGGTEGNFSLDPLFCDLEAGVYSLEDGSPCLPGAQASAEGCGLIGAHGRGCSGLIVQLDLLPGSCRNPFNLGWYRRDADSDAWAEYFRRKGGVLPAALVGSESFDVKQVDLSTIRLEGIEPLRSMYEDVTRPAPMEGDCPCSDEGADGIVDLTLKFSRYDLACLLGDRASGDSCRLTLSGRLLDGTQFTAGDCLTILHGGGGSNGDVPAGVSLGPAMPNPFNPATSIQFALPAAMWVSLSIFDVEGRRVATILDEVREAGENFVAWDGRDGGGEQLASGVYFYRLTAGRETLARKIVLLK